MITALISTILGLVGGVIPDIMKEIRETREHARELERLEKQSELQLKMLQAGTQAKLAEIDAQVYVEEMRAFRAQMENIYKASAPIGNAFIDGWNALLRPVTATAVVGLFMFTAILFTLGVMKEFAAGIYTMQEAAFVIWGSLVGEAIQAVMGFLWGYRTGGKLSTWVK